MNFGDFHYFFTHFPIALICLIGILELLRLFIKSIPSFISLIILLISIPLLIQTYGVYFITYLLAFRLSIPYNIAAPAALIGTSNFFELAVAVAISLFGLNSGAALATVVGVLVEVPVMLSLVAISNRTKSYFGDLNGNS